MSGLEGTIALVALVALGVWLLGPFLLRAVGLLLIVYGLVQLPAGDDWGWWVLSGFLATGGGQALHEFKRRARRSLATGRAAPREVGELEAPCRTTGKVKFFDERDAQEEVERNQKLYDRGSEDRFRLERSYRCEHCGWWHNTSQAKRR